MDVNELVSREMEILPRAKTASRVRRGRLGCVLRAKHNFPSLDLEKPND